MAKEIKDCMLNPECASRLASIETELKMVSQKLDALLSSNIVVDVAILKDGQKRTEAALEDQRKNTRKWLYGLVIAVIMLAGTFVGQVIIKAFVH